MKIDQQFLYCENCFIHKKKIDIVTWSFSEDETVGLVTEGKGCLSFEPLLPNSFPN